MALLPLKEEASFLSSANTNSNDEEPGSVYTEKGSLAVGCSEWVSFVTSITPGTEKDEVKRRFRPLFREDPLRAFRRAMMHGNLRRYGVFLCIFLRCFFFLIPFFLSSLLCAAAAAARPTWARSWPAWRSCGSWGLDTSWPTLGTSWRWENFFPHVFFHHDRKF